MQIGIIGAGRTGCSLGKYMAEHGQPVAGYYSRTKQSAEEAATFTESTAYGSLHEIAEVCDVLWITTPDDAVASVWEQIRTVSSHPEIICHFSGSLSSDVFSGRDEAGVCACSIHPMYAFSSKSTSYKNLNSAVITMEGDEKAVQPMRSLFEGFHNRVCVIAPDKKIRYHAAAVTASNLMIGLFQLSVNMLSDAGFDQKLSAELLKPLVQGNINKLLASSPEEALTGPVERGDAATVQKHLETLTASEQSVYRELSRILVGIASRKNPDADYTAVQKLLP